MRGLAGAVGETTRDEGRQDWEGAEVVVGQVRRVVGKQDEVGWVTHTHRAAAGCGLEGRAEGDRLFDVPRRTVVVGAVDGVGDGMPGIRFGDRGVGAELEGGAGPEQ